MSFTAALDSDHFPTAFAATSEKKCCRMRQRQHQEEDVLGMRPRQHRRKTFYGLRLRQHHQKAVPRLNQATALKEDVYQ
jgi:hypothetical protein